MKAMFSFATSLINLSIIGMYQVLLTWILCFVEQLHSINLSIIGMYLM